MALPEVFRFPNPVNDYAARTTAALVVALSLVTFLVNHPLAYLLVAVGFALRVAAGPRFSPFGLLATKVIVPRVIKRTKLVPGPPKRFAQTIGLVVSSLALAFSLAGWGLAAQLTLAVLVLAALAESALGFCLGCAIFGFLQRRGVIPESVCQACASIPSVGLPAAS